MLQVTTTLGLKAKFFRGFADPSRLAVLEALRDGPKNVSELVAATGLSQPNVSGHLACLKDCGLVRSEPQGRYVYYQLADERVAQLLTQAEVLLADVAAHIYACMNYDGNQDQCD